MARFEITTGTAATIDYHSEAYTCPYDTTYTDLRSLFEPCTGTTTNLPSFSTSAPSIPLYGDSLLQLADRFDAQPIFNLGSLTAG